ncbi:hypothetical protein EOM33_03170 [Candidatus Saccharibacteria bacterium]|nr:hypothetical protein [Candidatus Saccharibacteria bacterium]
MILFQDDWKRYPHAIPDTKTKNQTFLDFAYNLHKEAGVENCMFPLALFNADLQGIDPRRRGLPMDIQLAIKDEVYHNPWYFWREIWIIPPASGIKGVQFRLNRANCSLFWSYLQHLMYFLVQPRQTGKSTAGDGILDWLLYGRYYNTKMAVVTNTDKTRADNAKRLRDVKDYFPDWFVVHDRYDSTTGELVTYNARNNQIRLLVGAGDEKGAYRVGRGASTATQQWDEFPYIRQNEIAYTSGAASTLAVHELAEQNGDPFGIFFTTTAGRQDDRDGAYAYKLYSQAARWSDKLYDCANAAAVREVIQTNRHASSRMTLVQGTFSHTQVGVSDEKHYDNMSKVGAEGQNADMDFFNIWPVGGASKVFDQVTLDRITKSKMDPLYTEMFEYGFMVQWYLTRADLADRASNLTFVIGADTSEGGGGDSLSLVFTDYVTLEVLGTAVVNEVLIPRYAEFLFELLKRYPRSVLIPERKSTGQTFIDYLCIMLHSIGIDPFTRIWNMIVDNYDVESNAYMEIRSALQGRTDAFYIARKTKFGFCTGTTTRKTLYNQILKIAGQKAAHLVRDQQLIGELCSLEEKNGRIDHGNGGHDDTCIAWLLTVWMLVYGRNLAYYGIDRSLVMSRIASSDEQTEEDLERHENILALNAQVDDCIEILGRCDNPMLVQKYTLRLEDLQRQLEEYGIKPINISSLIEDVNDRRRRDYNSRR